MRQIPIRPGSPVKKNRMALNSSQRSVAQVQGGTTRLISTRDVLAPEDNKQVSMIEHGTSLALETRSILPHSQQDLNSNQNPEYVLTIQRPVPRTDNETSLRDFEGKTLRTPQVVNNQKTGTNANSQLVRQSLGSSRLLQIPVSFNSLNALKPITVGASSTQQLSKNMSEGSSELNLFSRHNKHSAARKLSPAHPGKRVVILSKKTPAKKMGGSLQTIWDSPHE